MNRQIIITAAVLGMLGVIAGAFAAHGLKPKLTPQNLEIWHTAVQYQFYHVFALSFLATTLWRLNESLTKLIYYLFTFGIIFFSGSLYLLACRDLLGWNWLSVMGPITPLGGLFFIAGWAALALGAFKKN
jgi:uncharacterized membrane protein YgdD (TMEM256/DUF423 family)